jgi:hypothetical protein
MFALIVVLLAAAFQEVGSSIGKSEAEKHRVGIWSLGFLNMLFGAIFMFVSGFFDADGFRFSLASLPTFAIRGALEILQSYSSTRALMEAERSTFGFLQVLTIPLLLAADMVIGYHVGPYQFAGISLIIFGFVVLFINHGIRKKGAGWALLSSANAATTISIYKYDITHFNSVAFEQTFYLLLLTGFFLIMARRAEKTNPLRLLKQTKYLIESLSMGVSLMLVSYGYSFEAASVVTTAKRAFTVLASIVSGNAIFKEKHLAVKLTAFVLTVGGLVMLAAASR